MISKPAGTSSGAVDLTAVTVDSEKRGSFVEQLMDLLDDDTYSNVVKWMPDGKAFTIVNPKRFTSVEMPVVFNIRNMSSFVRKLTRWGFTRAHDKVTMNSDIFMYKDFQRGNRQALSRIKCSAGRPATVSPSRSKVPPKAAIAAKPTQLAPTRPALPQPPTIHQATEPYSRTSTPPPPPVHVPPIPPQHHDGLPRRVSLDEDRPENWVEDNRHLLRTADRPSRGMSLFGPSSGHTDTGLGATIESLLRERESLLKDADANALALVRVLQEQKRVRMNELRTSSHSYFLSMAGAVPVASPPSPPPPSREHLTSYLDHHHHHHHLQQQQQHASAIRRVSGYGGVPHLPRY